MQAEGIPYCTPIDGRSDRSPVHAEMLALEDGL
jgi:hypothetical protein